MINYAEKYSQKVDERLTLGALTTGAINQEYEWLGVEAVKVYSIPTVELNDYSLTGTSRYGTPEELQNEIQTMVLTKDRSFTFSIDRKSHDDTMMVMEAGKALAREIDEKIIPEVDGYRLQKFVDNCPAEHKHTTAIDKSNAYEEFLNCQEDLDNANVPSMGRVAFITPAVYNFLKLDPSFIKSGDSSLEVSYKGFIGEIDSVAIIKTPVSRMPEDTNIIITHPMAMVAPIKLETYKIHQDPVGINGWLVEGRVRYDAFTLNNKVNCISINSTYTAVTKTVTYNGNGNDAGTAPSAQTVNQGQSVTVAAGTGLSKSGKAFKEWNTANDGSGTTYNAGASLTVNDDITLYAIYEA